MASNVSAAEVQALLGDPDRAKAGDVEPRDFRQPRRLSPEQLARLKRSAQRAQQELGRLANASFRSPTEVEIVTASEACLPEIVRSLAEPFAALLFDCGGQPCWTIWDNTVAVAAAERLLGATERKSGAARALSSVERALVSSFLAELTGLVAATYGLEPKNPRYVQDFVTLYATQDGAEQGDPQRLCVQVDLEGEHVSGSVRVYLHGVRVHEPKVATAAPAKDKHKPALPAHLVDLEVELSAELASVELPLDDVLALEPGDVIPLGVGPGSSLALYVEDEACGTARWGERGGRIALRITDFKKRSGAQPG